MQLSPKASWSRCSDCCTGCPWQTFMHQLAGTTQQLLTKGALRWKDTQASEACRSVFSRGCDRPRDLQLKQDNAWTWQGFKINPPATSAASLSTQTSSPTQSLLLSPQDMVPCWVAHTQDPSPQGIYQDLGYLATSLCAIWSHFPQLIICTHKLSLGFGAESFSMGTNQDFWFLPHDCSTICTQGECLEKNLPLDKWQGGDFIPEQPRGAGLCVSTKSPSVFSFSIFQFSPGLSQLKSGFTASSELVTAPIPPWTAQFLVGKQT